jgi:hypothetical protein
VHGPCSSYLATAGAPYANPPAAQY